MTRAIPTLLPLALLFLGCDGIGEPDAAKRLGTIAHYQDPVVTEAPDTVDAGQPFEVAVRTYGNGCVEKGETVVEPKPGSVSVWPYDLDSRRRDGLCLDFLAHHDHRATLVLREPGVTSIRFHGFSEPGASQIEVVRQVVVR